MIIKRRGRSGALRRLALAAALIGVSTLSAVAVQPAPAHAGDDWYAPSRTFNLANQPITVLKDWNFNDNLGVLITTDIPPNSELTLRNVQPGYASPSGDWDGFLVPAGCRFEWFLIDERIPAVPRYVPRDPIDRRNQSTGMYSKVGGLTIAVISSVSCNPGVLSYKTMSGGSNIDWSSLRVPPAVTGENPPAPASRPMVKRDDYNRDGVSDLVAVYGDVLHRWVGDGNGGFTYIGAYGIGWAPYASTLTPVGDINGDGNGDLVAVLNDVLYRWLGDGNGGFNFLGTYGGGWAPYIPTLTGAGDINGDGRADLVAVKDNQLFRWYGDSGGGLNFAGTTGIGWDEYGYTLTGPGDLNGDGAADLVAVKDGTLYRWFGAGNGTFTFAGTYGTGWTPYETTLMGMGDINRDGRADLLAVSGDLLHRWLGVAGGGVSYIGTWGPDWSRYFPGTPIPGKWKLALVKTTNTGSGKIEVHQAPNPYTEYYSVPTGLNSADAVNGNFELFGDTLAFFKTANTSSGKVELHLRTASTGYQGGVSTATWFNLGERANGLFTLANGDLVFIKTRNTGTGMIELHKVSKDNYAGAPYFSAGTIISSGDAGNGTFGMLGQDLVFIKTRSTAGGKVEVHIAGASCNYMCWTMHSSTLFNASDAANGTFSLRDVIGGDGIADLVFIKTRNTQNGSVELRVANGATGFTTLDVNTTAAFNQSDAASGVMSMNY